MQATSGSQERQGNGIASKPSRKERSLNRIVIFAWSDFCSWKYKTARKQYTPRNGLQAFWEQVSFSVSSVVTPVPSINTCWKNEHVDKWRIYVHRAHHQGWHWTKEKATTSRPQRKQALEPLGGEVERCNQRPPFAEWPAPCRRMIHT